MKLWAARQDDVPNILGFIDLLAAFEKELETAERPHAALFGGIPEAEARRRGPGGPTPLKQNSEEQRDG